MGGCVEGLLTNLPTWIPYIPVESYLMEGGGATSLSNRAGKFSFQIRTRKRPLHYWVEPLAGKGSVDQSAVE